MHIRGHLGFGYFAFTRHYTVVRLEFKPTRSHWIGSSNTKLRPTNTDEYDLHKIDCGGITNEYSSLRLHGNFCGYISGAVSNLHSNSDLTYQQYKEHFLSSSTPTPVATYSNKSLEDQKSELPLIGVLFLFAISPPMSCDVIDGTND